MPPQHDLDLLADISGAGIRKTPDIPNHRVYGTQDRDMVVDGWGPSLHGAAFRRAMGPAPGCTPCYCLYV